jgi:hypothetical protein
LTGEGHLEGQTVIPTTAVASARVVIEYGAAISFFLAAAAFSRRHPGPAGQASGLGAGAGSAARARKEATATFFVMLAVAWAYATFNAVKSEIPGRFVANAPSVMREWASGSRQLPSA